MSDVSDAILKKCFTKKEENYYLEILHEGYVYNNKTWKYCPDLAQKILKQIKIYGAKSFFDNIKSLTSSFLF
jgi:hypothetical protein